jgi:hypothetical protein
MIESVTTGTKFSRESQLLEPVARFAKRQGFRLQGMELPFYEYRIDLYGFSRRNNVTVAIELKLIEWRKALLQAMLYQLCADLVYIAMPEDAAKRTDHQELSRNGVGLIAVRNSGICSCLLPADRHTEVRHFYRRTQIEYLTGGTRG